jgi:hypothetical protein
LAVFPPLTDRFVLYDEEDSDELQLHVSQDPPKQDIIFPECFNRKLSEKADLLGSGHMSTLVQSLWLERHIALIGHHRPLT